VSQRIALITYTGRRSGHRYTIPVGYEMTGVDVTITVGSPDRKVWWRSLTGTGAPVELLVAASGEPLMPLRPGLEITRSFASRWTNDRRAWARLPAPHSRMPRRMSRSPWNFGVAVRVVS
jgi:hypothetical protein